MLSLSQAKEESWFVAQAILLRLLAKRADMSYLNFLQANCVNFTTGAGLLLVK
jgi:hypothetical protein